MFVLKVKLVLNLKYQNNFKKNHWSFKKIVRFLIFFYMNRIEYYGIVYELDEKEKTAAVIQTSQYIQSLIIPRLINHESQKYNVTSILNEALSCYTIKSVCIPMTVIELKKGWCSKTISITNIQVSSKNPRYKTYEDKFIIGKSSLEQENYDVLAFCVRNVKKVTIPSFIEIIQSYAFEYCEHLQEIEIPSDSKLRIIEDNAFYLTAIESINIPPHLTQINEHAFHCCEKLKKVEIPINSELHLIGKKAFALTMIEKILIPSNLVELKEKWCCSTPNLKRFTVMENNHRYINYENKFILGKSNPESKDYDLLVFARRDIEFASIPSYIKQIDSCAFSDCSNLRRVEIPTNSELRIIGEQAFSNSSIE